MIISTDMVEEKKEEIKEYTRNLYDSVMEFKSIYDEIESVITGLKVAANTSGGRVKSEAIQRFSEAELDPSKLLELSNIADGITVSSDFIRVDLD